ncbi:MAG: DUF1343 domain-containing protein [Candidatus Marinimicrobia bacterium]|nr:DUF1343 domain-containing protein [Candidatus Neomarinimicrobiota bacterium]MBL7009667.1 DUF1343 domain-containing protein [Candidatus Neomarinimicrobiota bacterium]MBL7029590.1 DUF1343 domain-containing protein [Candidatus Neomarinimicrobiota bacterium]
MKTTAPTPQQTNMKRNPKTNPIPLILLFLIGCTTIPKSIHPDENKSLASPNLSKVKVGLDILLNNRFELIKNKSVGLVTNQTGVDKNGIPNYKRFMALNDVDLKIIFSPEHGLFGEAAAGEKVKYNGQIKTLPKVASLYGKNRKPTQEQLAGLDIIIYDIQDIGARFYTYISTMGLVMEAAADAGIQVIVLDRPNPITNNRIEGPILSLDYQSFVGYYPIPIRYGLTVGELAKMIVGENWINSIPDLLVIPAENINNNLWFDETALLWIKPSPNIPDIETALIYPGMCLLEATNLNEGRGTYKPFKQFGAPWIDKQALSIALNNLNIPGVAFKPVSYTPTSIQGMSNNPRYKDENCHGIELIITDRNNYNSVNTGLAVIKTLTKLYPNQLNFNDKWMTKLWGKSGLPEKLINNMPIHSNSDHFQKIASKYRLYE